MTTQLSNHFGVEYYLRDAAGNILAINRAMLNLKGIEQHFLHEWAIYGNDSYGRVAVVRPDGGCDRGKARAGNDKKSFKEIFDEDNDKLVGVRTILEKYYEIKDHLGNVRLVLMDQKVSQNTNQAPFSAIPVELNNYYPFGMPEAGRSWSYQGVIFEYQYNKYENYTYGYNGMQRDNSKGVGSGYTTLFREYDPEIARWKSLDPKLKDFPSESPFSAMGNNPIMNTDVLGDKIKVDEQNVYQNQESGESFELFLTSKAGKQFWKDHAEKGQSFTTRFVKDSKGKPITLLASKDGKMHSKGFDVLLSTENTPDDDSDGHCFTHLPNENPSLKKSFEFDIKHRLFLITIDMSERGKSFYVPGNDDYKNASKERLKLNYIRILAHEALLEVWREEDVILNSKNRDDYWDGRGLHKKWQETPLEEKLYDMIDYAQKKLWNGKSYFNEAYIRAYMIYPGLGRLLYQSDSYYKKNGGK